MNEEAQVKENDEGQAVEAHPGERPARTRHESLSKRLARALGGSDKEQEAAGGDATEFTRLLLEDALRAHVSDVHLEPHASGIRVRFRVDGVLLDTMSLPHDTGEHLTRHLKAMCGLDPLPANRPASASRPVWVGEEVIDIRASVAPCVFGEKLVLRMMDVPQRIQHIDRLGLRREHKRQIEDWLAHVTGTVIVCGPTGSGKTTTLYSFLHELKRRDCSVVTIEDPVEYRVEGITQIPVHPMQGLTFAEGLRACLRLDPDYLMLGEIRDEDTAKVAMTAAGTGRVLMTTLHSKDAVGVLTALRNWGVDDFQLASALRVVIAQRLVRKLCEHCREEVPEPAAHEREWIEAIGRPIPNRMWRHVGCRECNDQGYKGRTGVFEVWRVDGTDAEEILAHNDDHHFRHRLRENGHAFLVDDALAKVSQGLTDIAEIRHFTGGG